MLQAKHLITTAGLCAAGFLISPVAQAETDPLATYSTPTAPAATTETALPSSQTAADDTAEVAEAEPLECPPGQFPSAFADVYPWEWAYQAVNNLASPSMTCFDLPADR